MSQIVFNIKNLNCAYGEGATVLHIPELHLPKGQLIFVIGKSGIGKSTLIETLGLMNNTIRAQPESRVHFHPENGQVIDLYKLWTEGNHLLSDFRRKYFSFIFQNTNLMPNFTCGENMIFSLLIKGMPYQEAKKEIINMMNRISLDPAIFDKKITEVSGGQRQRLAFTRAITADYSVLLGDEPTGNLDNGIARELMAILSETVKEKNNTCIIVSHDLGLACHFADTIIPITKKHNGNGIDTGIIENANIIHRYNSLWQTTEKKHIYNIDSYLSQFL